MKTRFTLLICALLAPFLTIGCDIASEPLAAFTFIRQPRPDATIRIGEPFRLRAEVEAEGPVDSLIVRLKPVGSGKESLRLHLNVPAQLQSGTGNLKAVIDTTLILDNFEPERVEHLLEVQTYLSTRRSGGSTVIPLRIEPGNHQVGSQ